MNQIIYFKNTNNIYSDSSKEHNINTHSKRNIFKIIFILSNFISICFICYFIVYYYNLYYNEKISKKLSNNYEIKTLYSSNENYTTTQNSYNYVIGIIEIKEIDINYPIISEYNEENLKISPCKYYGPNPNEIRQLMYNCT